MLYVNVVSILLLCMTISAHCMNVSVIFHLNYKSRTVIQHSACVIVTTGTKITGRNTGSGCISGVTVGSRCTVYLCSVYRGNAYPLDLS